MQTDKVCQEAIDKLGSFSQIGEMVKKNDELNVLLLRYRKVRNTEEETYYLPKILDKIADVEILLEQMKLYFDVDEKNITELKNKKLARLKTLLRTNS